MTDYTIFIFDPDNYHLVYILKSGIKGEKATDALELFKNLYKWNTNWKAAVKDKSDLLFCDGLRVAIS